MGLTELKQEALLQMKDGFCGGGLESRGLASGDHGSLPLRLTSPALGQAALARPHSRMTDCLLDATSHASSCLVSSVAKQEGGELHKITSRFLF